MPLSGSSQLQLYAHAAALFGRLQLPPCPLQLRLSNTDKDLDVYDPFRRRWVALTPEEWVRQHFADYLVKTLGFSAFRVANEVSLKLNGMNRRADSVVYDDDLCPLVIVEYKAADVTLTRKVLEQALLYNLVFEAPALMITNGIEIYTVHGNTMRRGVITALELRGY